MRVCFFPVDKKWASLVLPEVHFPEQEPWTVRSGAALYTIHCLHCIAISYVALSPPFWTFKNILWCTQLQHCAELSNICFTVYRAISSQSNTSSNTAKQVCFRLWYLFLVMFIGFLMVIDVPYFLCIHTWKSVLRRLRPHLPQVHVWSKEGRGQDFR